MRWLHIIWTAPLPLLLTTCAHRPPAPPPGMARLILDCCWIAENPSPFRLPPTDPASRPVCKQHLSGARVRLDDADAGTCLDWAGSGKLVRAGGHRIDVDEAPAWGNELEMCDCQGGTSAYVILRDGEVQTKFIGFAPQPYDPPD